MLLKTLALAAGLTAANAFLLPPEAAKVDTDVVKALPLEGPIVTETEPFKLPCPNCPIPVKADDGTAMYLSDQVDSHLEMTFKVERRGRQDHLLINDIQVYPPARLPRNTLWAPHVQDGAQNEAIPTQLGYAMTYRTLKTDPAEPMQLIAIDLQVIEIGDKFLDSIPALHIKLIKDQSGALLIGEIKAIKSTESDAKAPAGKQAGCTSLLCKWTAVVKEQAKKVRPAHKCGKLLSHHKFHPRPHKHHGHHEIKIKVHEHKWSVLFAKFAHHILFPILVGIVAGVTVSVIGMIIGTLIVGLWRVLVRGQPFFPRRRRHAGHSHKAARREAAVVEEKSSLMADQELPPAYRDEQDKPADA